MCTAVNYRTNQHYFGRTLDLEYSYCESVTITPRNYPISFRHLPAGESHFAIIGMAYVVGDYPLYYDAGNEKGLCIAGLRFQGNACYHPPEQGKDNVTPFELILWILGQCETVAQARKLLEHCNIVDESFSPELPVSPLHWIIADKECAITVESVKEGIKIYDNPVGVLTNNPPFEMQMFNLNHYGHVTAKEPKNHFSETLELNLYSRGMGGLGLPGDMSSMSRFVRASFLNLNGVSEGTEEENVSQFFHTMDYVAQIRGSVLTEDGKYELTVYTSCYSTHRGIYYYTTYENRAITGVDLNREKLDGDLLISYPLKKEPQIFMQNG